jgi:hypothetical protein
VATIAVLVRGGVVQQIIADSNIDAVLVDHDNDDGPQFFPVEVSTGAVQMLAEEASR